MRLSSEEILERLREIDRVVEPGSASFGRLLRWRDVVWHFGIGLSDGWIFNTGRGLDLMERRWVDASLQGGERFGPEESVERLKRAVEVFGPWRYDLLRWNCEHFARLVVSDEAVCHQVRELPGMVAHWANRGEHPEAAGLLRARLTTGGAC